MAAYPAPGIARTMLKERFPFVDIPSSKSRLQYINENPNAYLKILVPSEAFQSDDKFGADRDRLPDCSACILAEDLKACDLDACLDLIESTSSADYMASSIGWSRARKRKEMRLPDLRYILLRKSPNGTPYGFISFMLTFEDGFEVIYLYELHLRPEMQGSGVGKKMMAVFERAGRIAEVEKTMLTVFKANTKALRFYQNLGYVEDDFSPGPKKLRNGIVKEPNYIILSKEIPRNYDNADVQRLSILPQRRLPAGTLILSSRKRKAR